MNNYSEKLSKELTKYEVHHKNKTNILIHTYTIPLIISTTSVFLSYIPLPLFQNLSVLLFMIYCGYYYYLDEKLSMELNMYMFGLMCFGYISTFLNNYIMYNFLIFASCWAGQIAGHKYWEKNQPVFMQSLVDSFTIAPIFSYIHLKEDYQKLIMWIIRIRIRLDEKKYKNLFSPVDLSNLNSNNLNPVDTNSEDAAGPGDVEKKNEPKESENLNLIHTEEFITGTSVDSKKNN